MTFGNISCDQIQMSIKGSKDMNKTFAQSKTIVGVITMLIGFLIGPDIVTSIHINQFIDLSEQLLTIISSLLTLGGGIVAIYGRKKAQGPLGGLF